MLAITILLSLVVVLLLILILGARRLRTQLERQARALSVFDDVGSQLEGQAITLNGLGEKLIRRVRKLIETDHGKTAETFYSVYELLVKRRDAEMPFPIISEEELAVTERNSAEVWVLTASLKNDTEEGGSIQRAVFSNLGRGVDYTYFLPDRSDLDYARAQANLTNFLMFPTVQRHLAQIRIHHLPSRMLWSSPEIVVHNPSSTDRRGRKTHPRVFFYFDPEADTLVEAPPALREWIVSQLSKLIAQEPLNAVCQRLAFQFASQLDPESLAELHSFPTIRPSSRDMEILIRNIRGRTSGRLNPTQGALDGIFEELDDYFKKSGDAALYERDSLRESETTD